MIHYHGTPVTPLTDAARFFARRHAMVSFATITRGGLDQLPVIAEVAQSFVLDNGAFTAWKSGTPVSDWQPYYEWADTWLSHPGCEWALIPDVIDGDEAANDALVSEWPHDKGCGAFGVPIWHMHESFDRLVRLCTLWPRVALGSSGEFAQIGTRRWWERMSGAMDAICDERGVPIAKLHGLRMLDPNIFSQLPFASADSTNVARNMALDTRWSGTYAPRSAEARAYVIADRIENANAAPRWDRSKVHVQDHLWTLAPTRYMAPSDESVRIDLSNTEVSP